MLDVGEGNLVYWETCGDLDGKPALVVHGGPGSGCNSWHRRLFDPSVYRAVLFARGGGQTVGPVDCSIRRSTASCCSTSERAGVARHMLAIRTSNSRRTRHIISSRTWSGCEPHSRSTDGSCSEGRGAAASPWPTPSGSPTASAGPALGGGRA